MICFLQHVFVKAGELILFLQVAGSRSIQRKTFLQLARRKFFVGFRSCNLREGKFWMIWSLQPAGRKFFNDLVPATCKKEIFQ
jgi:hypothetical protein